MSKHKEVRNLVSLAERAGFQMVRYTGTGHYKMQHTNGQTLVIPSTPGGPRWKQNVLAEIRRAKRRKP